LILSLQTKNREGLGKEDIKEMAESQQELKFLLKES
jgi:hypothetical protein